MPTNFFVFNLESQEMLMIGAVRPEGKAALGLISENVSAITVACADDDSFGEVAAVPRIEFEGQSEVLAEELVERINTESAERSVVIGRIATGRTVKLIVDSDDGDVLIVLQQAPAQNAMWN